MSAENVNPQEELKQLDEQIGAAKDLAALKPIYYRLNQMLQAYPGDFDVQFTGDEIKQRLIARGALLKQQDASPPPPPVEMPSVQPPPLQSSFLEPVEPAPSTPLAPPPPPAMTEPLSPPPKTPVFDPPAPPPPPTVPVPPPTRPVPPPVPPRPTARRNPAILFIALAGLVLASLIILLVVRNARKAPNTNNTANNAASNVAAVQVDITTTPPGAAVKVAAAGGSETACTSDCRLSLAPGTYQVSASMEGFDAVAGAITVMAGQPVAATLRLQPQAQSIRLLTDLDRGKAVVDDRPPVDLQEGQLVIDRVPPGKHTVKVTGSNGDASFSFELADGRVPAIAGPVSARNMIAVLVASYGKQARVVTNAGPWKLAVNGQPQGDTGPGGTDLTGFQPGVNEIVVGEGGDRRNMSESFSAAPTLTAFLKTDVNAGTLIVSTGQDDVRVFLNDKEYRRRTQRGQLRIQTLGKVTVRVAKSGFQDAAAQTAEVKKGAEARLQFDLKPQPQQPQVASLQIHGGMPGAEVFVDQRSAGTVGPDGSFSLNSVQPGDHTVELRHEPYVPKRLQRSFRAGQAVTLAGADVALTAAIGTVKLARNPASATITYRRGEETTPHEARGNQIELPPGSYAFSASAPGFVDSTVRVQVAAGETREVDFALPRERVAAPVQQVVASGMAEFEDAGSWKKEGDSWTHKGGGFVPYKLPPKGVFTFTVGLLKGGGLFRAGQIRWCVQYLDPKTYLLYEMDRKNFWAGVVEKGKRVERVKAPHNLGSQTAFTIQIEVAPDRLVQKVRVGNEWKVLDTFIEPGRDFTAGKFGFLIQGNDEIAITDFKFQPK